MMKRAIIPMLLLCAFAQIAAVSAVDVSKPPTAPAPASWVGDASIGDLAMLTNSKDWNKKVSIEVKDVPLGDAIDTLLKGTDISCVVDPQVKSLKVTAVLKNVTLQSGLREIIKAAGATMSLRDNVLHISPTQPYSYLARALESQIAGLTEQLSKMCAEHPGDNDVGKVLEGRIDMLRKQLDDELKSPSQVPNFSTYLWANPATVNKLGKTQVFTINYINPAELVPLLYSLGARQVTVVSGGKLVVNGTEEAIQQVTEVIRQIDTEEALPRPVRVKVSVSYVLSDKNGPIKSADASMEGTTAEGQPIRLRTNSQVELSEVFNQTLMQETDLTPVVGPDDRITLTGGLKISNGVEGGAMSAVSESQIAVSTASGKPSIIGSGALMLPGMIGYKLEYEVTATATIGEGRLRVKPGGGMGGGGSLIIPGLGGYKGMGIFGGDSECFDPTQWNAPGGIGAVIGAAAAQWRDAFDIYGKRMAQFGATMDSAAGILNDICGKGFFTMPGTPGFDGESGVEIRILAPDTEQNSGSPDADDVTACPADAGV